jgi:tRNA (guanine37-N1)-methyltransferase
LKFTFVSLFPEMFAPVLSAGVIGRGLDKGLLSFDVVNPRDFAVNKHGSVDDTPYGGGPGMVMRPEPLVDAVESISKIGRSRLVMMTPSGVPFDQKKAHEFSTSDHIIFICGRYEGMDERVKVCLEPEEISLGDFVLSGGELAAMSIADATGRLIPGVLGDFESTKEESFDMQGLEYPQYTKPREYRGHEVPEVLLSGHHQAIQDWRKRQSQCLTEQRRPDLASGWGAVS